MSGPKRPVGGVHAWLGKPKVLILCYLPYGYVLFIGEQTFLNSYFEGFTSDLTIFFKRFLGDAQLLLWAIIPLRAAD